MCAPCVMNHCERHCEQIIVPFTLLACGFGPVHTACRCGPGRMGGYHGRRVGVGVQEELVHEVWAMAENLEQEHPGVHSQPLDVLCCSAETGEAVDELSGSIRSVLQGDQQADGDDDVLDWDTSLPETHPDSSARF